MPSFENIGKLLVGTRCGHTNNERHNSTERASLFVGLLALQQQQSHKLQRNLDTFKCETGKTDVIPNSFVSTNQYSFRSENSSLDITLFIGGGGGEEVSATV